MILTKGIFADTRCDEMSRYQCLQCGMRYRWQQSLIRHYKYNCNKPPQFQCPYCNKYLRRQDNLVYHIKKKHKDKWHLHKRKPLT